MTDPTLPEYAGYRMVKIIHPETGGVAEVPDSALGTYYGSGWTLLAPDDAPKPPTPPDAPAPLSRKEVADRQQAEAAAESHPAAPTRKPSGTSSKES
jgi:hypothetical protein